MDNIIEAKEVQIERKHFYSGDSVKTIGEDSFALPRKPMAGEIPSSSRCRRTHEFTAAIEDVLAATEQAPA